MEKNNVLLYYYTSKQPRQFCYLLPLSQQIMKHLFRTLVIVCLIGTYSMGNAQVIHTSIADTVINEGDTIALPITVEDFDGVASISLTMNYDLSVVELVGVQNPNPAFMGGLISGGIPPRFRLAWFSLAPVNLGNDMLIELLFYAHSPGTSSLSWDTLTSGNCQYSDSVADVLPAMFTNGSITAIPLAQGAKVKMVLQNAWNGTNMNTTLNAGGYLPLAQPYNTAPWNYSGAETLDSIPAGMVDWVLVELRDPVDGATIVERRAAILMSDGSILDTDMDNEVAFDSTGSYYVAIDHRNHLPVMSANPMPIPDTTLIDFTSGTAGLFGGSNSVVSLTGGVFGMIAGDINGNGILKYAGAGNDRVLILIQLGIQTGSNVLTNTTTGYFREDLSMDGVLKYAGGGNDAIPLILNLINLTGSTAITTTFTSPVPQAVTK